MANSIKFNKNYPVINNSLSLLKRSENLIPCNTQTLAKGPSQYVQGIAPIYLQSGKGCHVIDVDENEYIDYTMGVGPISLGYCYDKVDKAIQEQLKQGITFSLVNPLEVEVAELIREIVPNAESVRFSKSGNDVTSAAVRLARAYTGKNTVLCCGYHGWHDWYIAVTDKNAGIPEAVKDLTYTFNYNDIESVLSAIDSDTAAIILEPVVFEEPKNKFLHQLRELCTQKGIVLIFDEMWTGFRMSLGGAQEYFGIKADLATFSKALANGMPLSVITGKHDIMQLLEHDVFFFTTFGGETLSLAAAKATILELKDKHVNEYLNRQGKKLKDAFNAILDDLDIDFVKIAGYNFRTILNFNSNLENPLILKSYMQQELIKRGILWSGFHNMSFSHSDEDINYTIAAYKDILPQMQNIARSGKVSEALKGSPVGPVFRKVGNFNMKPKKQS